jgi:hypothetical protein
MPDQKYRLYIDEVGNSDLGSSNDPNRRYLSLTGVILGLEYVRTIFQPENALGDVLAEARGGKEDMRLKTSFERVYGEGSEWVSPDLIPTRLTSRQLKAKTKVNNIAGLQLADLVAHPSHKVTLARRNGEVLPETFGGKIGTILIKGKYVRSPANQIDGWGMKWLP